MVITNKSWEKGEGVNGGMGNVERSVDEEGSVD
jgi:hypothetical protein